MTEIDNTVDNGIGYPDGISVIVPAYNEEALLRGTVEHLVNTAPIYAAAAEIIIVNDGSSDNTAAIAAELAEKHQIVEFIQNPENLGFGATVRHGFQKSSFKYVMYTPVDYHFSAKEFDIYLTLIKYSDIVIGYRRERRKDLGVFAWMVSVCYHRLVNVLFRLNYYDVNWIHLYKRDQVFDFIGRSDGVFLLAETLIRARGSGFKTVGVDVDFIDREEGVATGVQASTILKTLRELFSFLIKSS